ncbi:MAG: hypothetical protein FWE36_01870 [Erysipelotrichales bacterium]|nr:hypothetical protein [Erysipelotrichales bacterium]
MQEHIGHTRIKYEIKNAFVSVNVRTGRVLAEIPATSIGSGDFQINVSHIYNPSFIANNLSGFRGHWKLNLRRTLTRSSSSQTRNLIQYTYIDESGFSHIFRYMGHLGNTYQYFDVSGLNLILTTTGPDNMLVDSQIITDEFDNQLRFDLSGNLTETRSATNMASIKNFIYINGFLSEVRDARIPWRRITFHYSEMMLVEIRYILNNRIYLTYNYDYDISNNLRTISRRERRDNKRISEHITHIFYDSNSSRIAGLFDTRDNETIKITYDSQIREEINKITAIETGIASATNTNRGLIRVGGSLDVSFFGEVRNDLVIREQNQKTNFTYDNNFWRTTLTNEKGINLNYYFDLDGFLVSILEAVGPDLRELLKRPGRDMLNPGNDQEMINGENSFSIHTSWDITNANDGLLSQRFENVRSYRNTFAECRFFTVGFWLKLEGRLNNNRILVTTRSNGQTTRTYSTIDNRANGVWQYVEVTVEIPNHNLEQILIHFPGGVAGRMAKIAGMKIVYSDRTRMYLTTTESRPNNQVVIHREILENIDVIGFWDTFTPFERGIRVNNDFYFTESDIQATYESFIKRTGAHFILSACDGTWKMLVSSARYIFFNQNSWPVRLASNRAEYLIESRSMNNEIVTQITTNFIPASGIIPACIGTLSVARKDNITRQIEERHDFQGRIRLEVDEYEVRNEYTYNQSNNVTRITRHPQVSNETFLYSTNIASTNASERSQLTERVLRYLTPFSNPDVSEFFGFNANGTRDMTSNYQLNSTYNSMFDRLDNIRDNVNGRNILQYENVGRLSNLQSEGSNYSYAYQYNEFGDVERTNIIRANVSSPITEMHIDRSSSIVTAMKYRTASDIDTTNIFLDKYGRVSSTIEDGSETIFMRQNNIRESEIVSEISQYLDPFEEARYTFFYSDGNELTEYRSPYVSIWANPRGTEYRMHQTLGIHNLSLTRIILSDNHLFAPRVTETEESLTDPNSPHGRDLLNVYYGYDRFGRFSEKVFLERTRHGITSSERRFHETYQYHNGTEILRQIVGVTPNRPNDFRYLSDNWIDTRGNIQSVLITWHTNAMQVGDQILLYNYDRASRVISEVSQTIGRNIEFRRFRYNTDGSLKEEDFDGDTRLDNGNPIFNGITINYNYIAGRLMSITRPQQTLNFDYDRLGNCTNYMSRSMEWERGSLLKRCYNVGFLGNQTFTYHYNSQGIRFKKTAEFPDQTIEYVYDGNKLLVERENATRYIRFIYDYNGIIGFVARGFESGLIHDSEEFIYYFIKDTLNNVIGLRSGNNNHIIRYEYDAWGNTIRVLEVRSGSSHELTLQNHRNHIGIRNPIRWKSQYLDLETQLYFIEGRYYSPIMRQFISPEAPEEMVDRAILPNSLNSYLLTVANPVSLVYNSYTIETTMPLYTETFALSRFQARMVRLMGWYRGLPLATRFAIGVGAIIAFKTLNVLTLGKAGVAVLLAKKSAVSFTAIGSLSTKAIWAYKSTKYVYTASLIVGGISAGFGVLNKRSLEGAVDGFTIGVVTTVATTTGAKAIGLAKIGLVYKVIGKTGTYGAVSIGSQPVFNGTIDWRKVGISAIFGVVGQPWPTEGLIFGLSIIGLSTHKEFILSQLK